ncbi:MAG: hypothetical protein K9L26_04825 [Candidatus Izimaplasma sp.]|nr:hypothetical protein [Candidatus Izimaplasma bacterium]
MKRNLVMSIPLILVLLLTGLMFIEKDNTLLVVSNPSILSSYQSSVHETMSITVLSNQSKSYHFDKDYITKAAIVSGEEQTRINITDINSLAETTELNGQQVSPVHITFKLDFHIEQGMIQYTEANLLLYYHNGAHLSIPIGEFHYVFLRESSHPITLGGLSATTEEIDGITTVSGIYLELGNISNNNIVIKQINLLSCDVIANHKQTTLVEQTILYDDHVTDVIPLEQYDFHQAFVEEPLNHLILKQQSQAFYVPLIYQGDIAHIERFVIEITYEQNNTLNTIYLDDFPFMRQNLFGPVFYDDLVILDGPIKD